WSVSGTPLARTVLHCFLPVAPPRSRLRGVVPGFEAHFLLRISPWRGRSLLFFEAQGRSTGLGTGAGPVRCGSWHRLGLYEFAATHSLRSVSRHFVPSAKF